MQGCSGSVAFPVLAEMGLRGWRVSGAAGASVKPASRARQGGGAFKGSFLRIVLFFGGGGGVGTGYLAAIF